MCFNLKYFFRYVFEMIFVVSVVLIWKFVSFLKVMLLDVFMCSLVMCRLVSSVLSE